MTSKRYTNQKGQALLFVVVAMTIALTIGINASVRTITSLSRTTRTDTASRALAAAEGGIERFLARNTQELRGMAESNTCPIGTYIPPTSDEAPYDAHFCRIDFTSADGINTRAYVQVEVYQPNEYVFDTEPGEVKEVNLKGLDGSFYNGDTDSDGVGEIEICWRTQGPNNADIYYIAYDQNGMQATGGLSGTPGPDNLGYSTDGFINPSSPVRAGFEHCQKDISLGSDVTYGLRIRALGEPATVGVFSSDDTSYTIPLQGFRITSTGRLQTSAGVTSGVTASRKITVIRSLPYLPAAFDYAVYSRGAASFN